MLLLLMFLYIFDFKIYGFVSSSMIVLLVMIIKLMLDKEFRNEVTANALSYSSGRLIFCYLLITIWGFMAIAINGTNDYSFYRALIHGIVQIYTGVILASLFIKKSKENEITKYIVLCFVIQAIIETSAFVFPGFRQIIQLTKSAESVERLSVYMGIRGLGLAGSDVFGLAICFALVFVLMISPKHKWFSENSFIKIVSIILLLFGGIVAARTALIGFAYAIGIACLFRIKENRVIKVKKQTLILGPLSIIAVIGVMTFFVKNVFMKMQSASYYIYYMFEGFLNFFNTGTVSMSSTDNLFDNMYFSIPFKTLLIGDGMYSGVSGGYYMGTDAGFMRPVLFMGIMGIILLLLIQINILKLSRNHRKLNKYDLAILGLAIILQIKGEVIGYALMFNSCVVLYVFQRNESETKEIDVISE